MTKPDGWEGKRQTGKVKCVRRERNTKISTGEVLYLGGGCEESERDSEESRKAGDRRCLRGGRVEKSEGMSQEVGGQDSGCGGEESRKAGDQRSLRGGRVEKSEGMSQEVGKQDSGFGGEESRKAGDQRSLRGWRVEKSERKGRKWQGRIQDGEGMNQEKLEIRGVWEGGGVEKSEGMSQEVEGQDSGWRGEESRKAGDQRSLRWGRVENTYVHILSPYFRRRAHSCRRKHQSICREEDIIFRLF
jgi:hypothetical protein